jgi:hypothetical protein
VKYFGKYFFQIVSPLTIDPPDELSTPVVALVWFLAFSSMNMLKLEAVVSVNSPSKFIMHPAQFDVP